MNPSEHENAPTQRLADVPGEGTSAEQPAVVMFLDEAGYTGPDLVNAQQPVYVLASTTLSEDAAKDLLSACFRHNHESRELKHSRLSRTRAWRAEMLEFARRVPADSIAYFAVHKEFASLAFLIDFWLEPMAYRDGINLYENGANIALSNVSYITLRATLGVDGCRELLRKFQVMTRDRTPFAYNSFWDSFLDATRRHPLVDQALGGLIAAEQRLGWQHLLDLPAHLLDVGDYGILDTVVHWRKRLPQCFFRLVHDRSKMIERNRERWLTILVPTNPKALVGSDRRTIEFPLPVQDLAVADSQDSAGLQVADLVAGASSAVWRARVLNEWTDYTRALMDSGLIGAAAGGIWPTDKISPADLETEGPFHGDAADFIAGLLRDQDRIQT